MVVAKPHKFFVPSRKKGSSFKSRYRYPGAVTWSQTPQNIIIHVLWQNGQFFIFYPNTSGYLRWSCWWTWLSPIKMGDPGTYILLRCRLGAFYLPRYTSHLLWSVHEDSLPNKDHIIHKISSLQSACDLKITHFSSAVFVLFSYHEPYLNEVFFDASTSIWWHCCMNLLTLRIRKMKSLVSKIWSLFTSSLSRKPCPHRIIALEH